MTVGAAEAVNPRRLQIFKEEMVRGWDFVRGRNSKSRFKAAGITLYTIQVNTDGDPTSPLLQNCASSSDKLFLLTSASEIVTTFNQIGTNLSRLYVTK